jgi:hypothetical protein
MADVNKIVDGNIGMVDNTNMNGQVKWRDLCFDILILPNQVILTSY